MAAGDDGVGVHRDGWSDERALQQRADRAGAAIIAEIASNEEEMDGALVTLGAAAGGVLAEAPDPAAPQGGSVRLELPAFSRAAWQTSQRTDATTRPKSDWLIQVARAYETRALYSQLSVDVVRTMAELGTQDQKAALGRSRGQIGALPDVPRALAAAYDEILADGKS